jgi:4-hydroxymandelate oxidase
VTPRDLEAAARKVLPPDLFAFIASGARDEITSEANSAAWRQYWFVPRLLVDVAAVCTATTVLGQRIALPVLAAPMSLLGLVHPHGDVALARAVADAGSIAVISQSSLSPIEEIARGSGAHVWAQHYPLADRAAEEQVVHSAIAAGADAIVVTLDFPLNGLTLARPAGGYTFPSADRFPPRAARGQRLLTSITMDYVDWLRAVVPPHVPIVAKGVMRADDGLRLADHGINAVVVSNHGGRTLDGTLPTAEVLPEVTAAVKDRFEVYVDGGIRSGGDVLRALSLGARAALVGRPLAWGLARAGQSGVQQVLDTLRRELTEDAALAGVADLSHVPADLVRRRGP